MGPTTRRILTTGAVVFAALSVTFWAIDSRDRNRPMLPYDPRTAPPSATAAASPRNADADLAIELSCMQMPKLAQRWRDLATLAGESADPAADVDRAEVENLIEQFSLANLPPEAVPYLNDVVTPLVQLRGAIFTRTTPTIDFGPGRNALDAILALCGD